MWILWARTKDNIRICPFRFPKDNRIPFDRSHRVRLLYGWKNQNLKTKRSVVTRTLLFRYFCCVTRRDPCRTLRCGLSPWMVSLQAFLIGRHVQYYYVTLILMISRFFYAHNNRQSNSNNVTQNDYVYHVIMTKSMRLTATAACAYCDHESKYNWHSSVARTSTTTVYIRTRLCNNCTSASKRYYGIRARSRVRYSGRLKK